MGRASRGAPIVLPLACFAIFGGQARAADDDAIVKARVAVEEQRYDDALAAALPATHDPSPRRRVSALAIVAVVHGLDARPDQARASLDDLYELAPGYLVDDPSLPPGVLELFAEAAAKPRKRAVGLRVQPLAGADYELRTTGTVARVVASCDAGSRGNFAPVALRPTNDGWAFRLPTREKSLCFATALDESELPLGRLGTRKSPVVLTPTAEKSKGVPWWVWPTGGVAIAGAALATFVIVRASENPASPPQAQITLVPR